jgi:hypothetical protein
MEAPGTFLIIIFRSIESKKAQSSKNPKSTRRLHPFPYIQISPIYGCNKTENF